MWQYNNTDELYHYGVLGMKWGHRKPVSDLRSRYDKAKSNFKKTKKQYREDHYQWDKARKHNNTAENMLDKDRRYKTMINSASNVVKAKDSYKKVRDERKKAIEKTAQDVKKSRTRLEKIFWDSKGVAKNKAAKYIVDNNMSLSDAKKKVNRDTIRKTAIVLGTIGAMTVSSVIKIKNIAV